MSGVATAIAVTGTYGAYQSGEAAKDAARSQEASAQRGIEFQREALEALRSDLDPFRQFGSGALSNLQSQLGITPIPGREQLAQQQALGGRTLSEQAQQGMMGLDSSRQNELIREIENSKTGVGRLETERQQALQIGDQGTAARIQSYIDEHNRNQQRWSEELQSQPLTQDTLQYYLRTGQENLIPEGTFAPQPTGVIPDQQGRQPGQPVQQQIPGNPLLDQAMAERASYDPMNNPLLAQAQRERMAFDPLSNPLLASASERQMAMDPSKAMSPDILQNPLLRAMQEDVARRLMANQAARGKLGSGGTAEELQNRLVPQAIQFGLQMNELQRQDISDRARLGGAQVGLQEAAMAGREGLGFGLDELQRAGTTGRLQAGLTQEDLQQRQIANLMDAARLGQASAAQTGQAGQSAASQMGNLSLAAGQASAAGSLGRAQAINQGLGSIAGAGLYALGNFSPGAGSGGTFNQFQPTTGQFGQFTGL